MIMMGITQYLAITNWYVTPVSRVTFTIVSYYPCDGHLWLGTCD